MRGVPSGPAISPVTIRVSGKLSYGHLSYLEWLIDSAADCELRVVLDLEQLEEIDRDALFFLMDGENREFGLVSCPNFIREWMAHEEARHRAA